jgi:pyridoxal phosphate enzyme (YggS family)
MTQKRYDSKTQRLFYWRIMSQIRENLQRVRERIEGAARRAGRDPKDVRLVAVSKTVEVERIREAIDAGVTILGENYVQEAQRKIEQIGKPVSWHFIGHLQSNKAKYAVNLFEAIHSLDSQSLAEELDRRAERANVRMKVMIEVNLSGEATKFGTEEEKVFQLARRLGELRHLSLEGLMTMPPYVEDPEVNRPYFIQLRTLKEKMAKEGILLGELSMGMSNDFEVAIEEGATYVRVGTAIFGARK